MDKYTNVIQHMLRDTSSLQKIEKRKKKSKTLLQKKYHNQTLNLKKKPNPSQVKQTHLRPHLKNLYPPPRNQKEEQQESQNHRND